MMACGTGLMCGIVMNRGKKNNSKQQYTMAINLDILNQQWEGREKGVIEDALKELLLDIITKLLNPIIADNSVGISALTLELRNKINNALSSESDPTVPAWAKSPTKPRYTAREVEGALTESDVISMIDDLTGGTISAIRNSNDGQIYNIWVGTQEELNLLNGDYDENTIYLVGTVPAGTTRFSVINNFTEAEGATISQSNDATRVVSGSEYSNVLSVNSGYRLSNVQATMAGGGQISVTAGSNGTYEIHTLEVTGNITITAAASAIGSFAVDKSGIGNHITVSGTDANTQSVLEGGTFSIVLTASDNYTLDSVTVNGVQKTITNNSCSITVSNVQAAIIITASATMHIDSINVTAGTRNANTIPLSAAINPSNADNVTLQWSISEDGTTWGTSTTNFSLTDNGSGSATLTVKSSASNASVTVKCADTNAASDDATGTLQLTGLSYEETPIPITEITDISATRTAANTLKLEATADGNTPITFSIVGTAPKVKQLNRSASPITLDDVDNVVRNGDTLTYKEDCKVTIQASAENGTVTFQKEITIEHANADAIWFEDEVTLAALNSNSVGSGGKVTYSQAAALTSLKFLAGNTSIRRFKEFMWFTGITQLGPNAGDKGTFKNCSNLECIGLPNVTVAVNAGTNNSAQPFYGCKLREFHIHSLSDFKLNIWTDAGRMINAGKSSEGLGLFINGQEVYDVIIPEGVGIGKKYAGFNRITSFTAEYITSFPVGSLDGCTALTSLKIGDGVTQFGDYALSGSLTNLSDVDLGSGISALGEQCFRDCTSLMSLTLRYDGVVTQNNSFYNAALIDILGRIQLHVPSEQVEAYKADTTYWAKVNDNNITAITD